jgi:hypothetical protein
MTIVTRILNGPTLKTAQPADFLPLHLETRTHVTTDVMCHHLGRKAQTARVWACYELGPLRPIRVCGRLAWAVADIKRILGVSA